MGGFHSTKHGPILGVITMLPALNPTQTVLLSDGNTDSRILGSVVSSSTPMDFHPSSHIPSADRPEMNRQT
ncbi:MULTISPECIES: hypothetical protein [unclassified Corallococcus]|uniref:hypothetical protein n=1 Tax=unclassified Corallococcus TaxID=2685029 RepID=UPI001A8E6C4F|nr:MULTISPECIES: hypothetical protein [unclassified Corallococcus]MBN9688408.1 hypothetical protein [Corallococcus sp. NCSPR001]WAS87792.1 hypothetical protein O0N60_12620 [Corallococcus sp. NCRR]